MVHYPPSSIQEHHLRFAEAGYATVPLYPHSKKPLLELLPQDENGKPLLHPFLNNPVSVSTVLSWHRQFPGMNYGLAMGPTNNLMALDIDDRHGGWQGYRDACGGEEYDGPQHHSGDAGAHLLHPHPGAAFNIIEPIHGCQLIQSGYIAAPGSLHPDGGTYKEKISLFDREPTLPDWLHKRICPDASFSLGLEDANDVSLGLTPTNLKLCLDILSKFDHRRSNYQSTSEFDFAIINRLIAEGASLELIFKAFRDSSVETKFARLMKSSREGAERYLQRSYNKAKSTTLSPAQALRSEALARFHRFAAEQLIWQGRGMLFRKRILLAHLNLAVQVRRDTWDLSSRDGHLMTGHGVMTFVRYTRHLVEEGWLKVVQKANPGRSLAATYTYGERLVELGHHMAQPMKKEEETQKCISLVHTPPPLPVVVCTNDVHFLEHRTSELAPSPSSKEAGTITGASLQVPEGILSQVTSQCQEQSQDAPLNTYGAFERQGFGPAGEAVYFCLKKHGSLAIAQIAKRTGLHRNTVRLTLLGREAVPEEDVKPRKGMVTYSLILQEGRLYRINPEFKQWEELAVSLQVRHLAELRERTVAIQREEHRAQVYLNRAKYIKKKFTKKGRW